jgi:hypothetical protein
MTIRTHLLAAKSSLLSLLILAGIAVTASGQYLISSKAGFVNLVEGKAHIQRQGTDASAETLKATLGTQLKNGDRLTTAAEGFAELLLSPGSYLRLSEKSEVVATNTSLSETRFDLVRGSVIVEVGEIDKKLPVEIGTPRGVFSIAKAGIYRFDLRGEEVSVAVRRGELFIGTREQLLAKTATKVKSGKFVKLSGGAPELAKLSPKVFDDFDVRSYQRAETLVAANYSLLSRSRRLGSLGYGWVFDPFTNTYTFVPRSWYFASPYGFGFFHNWADCGYCSPFMYYYPGRTTGGQNAGGGSTGVPPRSAVVGNEPGAPSHAGRRDANGDRRVEPYSRPNAISPSRIDSGGDIFSGPSYGSRGDFGSSRTVSPSSPSVSPGPSAAPARDMGGGGGNSGRTGASDRRVQ